MAAPSSSDELLDLVRKSGVGDEKRLDTYMQQLRASGGVPPEPGKLAGLMVRDGLLTHFQAEQFLLGKWRRFTIGKYKVLERLGSGGMGSVYLCEHKFMRRRVAVKVLPAAKAEDPSSLERFYREARAAAALDHPNIVRAYDIDQDDNLHFLVMEYVDGASLQEIVKKTGPMEVLRAAHYARQAAIGLQHAHEAGLVHRDIKPGNLLVARDGTVKILDMGLARFFHDEEDMLTKKYDESVLGTADYLAPEQAIDSHGVDIRADIYSLGATVYFILTGQPPFSEGTVAQKLIWHQTRQPKPVTAYRQDIPADLLGVLNKMMAKEMKERYQTPAEVVEALAPFVQVPIPPPPEIEMPRLSPAAMGSNPSEPSSVQPSSPSTAPTTVRREAARGPASPRPMPHTPQPSNRVSPGTGPALDPRRGASTPSPAFNANNVSMMPEAPARPGTGVAEEAPAWERLAAVDTDNPSSRLDTDATAAAPGSVKKLSTAGSGVLSPRERQRVWIVVGSVVAVVGIGLAVYLATRGGDAQPATATLAPGQAPATWYVKRDPTGDDSFPTISEALNRTKPGDTILVQKPLIEEQLLLINQASTNRGKGVTIKAGLENGAKVTWRPPAAPAGTDLSKLVDCVHVEGLKLQGFVLDGQNRVNELVSLGMNCAGLTLEDMQFQGYKTTALHLTNCWGDAQRPIRLDRLVVMPPTREADAAVIIESKSNIPTPCRYIKIRDCRMAGPFKAVVQIEGQVEEIDLFQNRFANAADGITYNKANRIPSPQLQLLVESNTFADLKQNGLFFKTHPLALPNAFFAVNVKNNLFVQVVTLANVQLLDAKVGAGVINSPAANGNVRVGGKEGNITLNAAPVNAPAPVFVEAKDPGNPQFLVYPAASPLNSAGVANQPVGFPPPPKAAPAAN
jgi:serine/threonine protein kinase